MDWSSIMKSIKSEPIAPVYTVIGEEHTLAGRWLEVLRSRLGQDGALVQIDRYDFEEEGCDNALLACQSISLFGESGLVVLERSSFLLPNAKVKHDLSSLERYLENPVPGRVLILRVIADKMDERKKIVKQIKKHPVISLLTPKTEEAVPILQQLAAEKGIQMADEAIQELWRRCQSIALSDVELDKLTAYTDNRRVETADVAELVPPPLEDNVFTWIDSVVKGNVHQTFRSLTDVQSAGYDAFALFSLMARQLRMMWYARVLGDKGYTHVQLAKQLGAHPYAVKLASAQARAILPKTMEHMLTAIADAEYWVKSGRWDVNQALEYIVLFSARLIQQRPGKISR